MRTNIISKVTALIARAVRAPLSEEGRTSAVIAIQLIAEHHLLGDVTRDPEIVYVRTPVTDAEIDEIIHQYQVKRARKGGRARAKTLTSEELSDAATRAARSRWRQWRQRRRAGKTG